MIHSPRPAAPRPTSFPRAWRHWTAIGLATLAASGCAVFTDEKVDYRSARKVSTLEVPPDLTQLNRDSRYVAPAASVTASSLQAASAAASVSSAANGASKSSLRIERAGNQRWLVVDRAPEKLWDPLRQFWQDSGFTLALDQPDIGIMETEWAENRAKLPQDFLRGLIGKALDALYSTGERDKFRTRIERSAQGGSEIYISHRGMMEVYTSDRKDQTVWQPRPTDPELEAEFLRRLMVKLGTSPEQAQAALAATAPPAAAKLDSQDGQPVLQFSEGFDRAWRRVGLALDRTGFTVEDRDRNQGIYFVRYVGSAEDPNGKGKPGFFSRLFSSEKEAAPQSYRIQLKSGTTQTAVSVLDAQGRPDTSANARKILQLLADDLK